jgi:hypothetical protein
MSGSESLLNDEFDFSSPFDNMDDMDRLKSPLNDEEGLTFMDRFMSLLNDEKGLHLGKGCHNFHNNSNDSVSDFSDTHAGTTNFSWDNPNKNQNSFQHDEYNWSWIEMNSFFKQLNQSNDKKDKSGDSNNFDTNVDIKNEKDKIDMAKNKKEKKNKGRPKNKKEKKDEESPKNEEERNGNGLHTRKSLDNAGKAFITACKKSLHISLFTDIKKYLKGKKKIPKFNYPIINNYLNQKNAKKLELFDTPVKDLYKEKDKITLDIILQLEKGDETIKTKVLNLKYNAKFLLYLKAFLYDKKTIIINGEEVELNNFKTLSECFNEGKREYDKNDRKNTIIYLEKMIKNKLQVRKERRKLIKIFKIIEI